MELDKWQKDVLNTEGNIVLRSGRQGGKSTVISILAGEEAIKSPKSIMVISATERQAYLLFSKILYYLSDNYKKFIKGKPTKSEIVLKNGSVIRCLPTGMDGLGIRGYTVNLLIADEAAFIYEDVWPAIIPSLVTTGGRIILLSTPYGRNGYFYEAFNDSTFTKFHVTTEEVAMQREEPMRSRMLQHLEHQKATMSSIQYAQEYLGEFVDEARQLFNDKLIRMWMTEQNTSPNPKYNHYLGIDLARMGEDESSFEILAKDGDIARQKWHEVTTKQLMTETFDKILNLNKVWKPKKIGIDDAGVGAGVFDFLLREPSTKTKVIPLNNARRSLDSEDKQKKTLLKEDMYMDFLAGLEKGKIRLINDEEIFQSLKSVQYEYITTPGKKTIFRIFGNNTHIAEGLIRAYRVLQQDKSLNLWADYI